MSLPVTNVATKLLDFGKHTKNTPVKLKLKKYMRPTSKRDMANINAIERHAYGIYVCMYVCIYNMSERVELWMSLRRRLRQSLLMTTCNQAPAASRQSRVELS